MGFITAFLLPLLFVINLVVLGTQAQQTSCKNVDGKCKDGPDPRPKLHKCMMDHRDWSLLCNYSSYEELPSPKDLYTVLYTQCTNATSLTIEDSCLKSIKRGKMRKYSNLRTFFGGLNFIQELPNRVFAANRKLEFIDLCGNSISNIDSTAFTGLSELRYLNLASNEIKYIPDFMFRGLTSLQELSLHHNNIEVLHDGIFHGLTNLKKLWLTANKISSIDPNAFDGLNSLTHLHLDMNGLTKVDAKVFANLTGLQVLTMADNAIESWPNNSEKYLKELVTLDIGHNLILEFSSKHLTNMTKLRDLSLERNFLSSLSEDTFVSTPNIRNLNFANNSLEGIGTRTFSDLCQLRSLNLRGNKLRTPRAEWFATAVESNDTEGTDLGGNKWICDCDTLAYEKFRRDLEQREVKSPSPKGWSKILQIRCSSPDQLAGQLLDSMTALNVNQTGCAENYPNVVSHCKVNEKDADEQSTMTTANSATTPAELKAVAEKIFAAASSMTKNESIQVTFEPKTVSTTSAKYMRTTLMDNERAAIMIWSALGVALVVIAILLIHAKRRSFQKCFANNNEGVKEEQNGRMFSIDNSAPQTQNSGGNLRILCTGCARVHASNLHGEENTGFLGSVSINLGGVPDEQASNDEVES